MPVSEWLKTILVCPVDRTVPLIPADTGTLDRLNAAIRQGVIVNRGGKAVTEPLEAALIRRDGAILYPVLHGIPALVSDDGIDCTDELR